VINKAPQSTKARRTARQESGSQEVVASGFSTTHPPGEGPGALEQPLDHLVLPAGGDPYGGLRGRLAQPLFDYPGVGGFGVWQGYQKLSWIRLSNEVRGAQGIECPTSVLLSPAILYNQGQHGERQVELVGDGDLLPQRLLEGFDGL
jgi:hypothetical protein